MLIQPRLRRLVLWGLTTSSWLRTTDNSNRDVGRCISAGPVSASFLSVIAWATHSLLAAIVARADDSFGGLRRLHVNDRTKQKSVARRAARISYKYNRSSKTVCAQCNEQNSGEIANMLEVKLIVSPALK